MKEYGTFEDFYNLFKNWSKKDILRRTYDIAQESIQKENIIKEVREEIIKYKEIMENGIEQGAYYSYLGSLQQKLDKFLEILDKGE